MTNTHAYFIEAALVWEEYFAKAISMSKRDEALKALRARYLK